MIRTSDLRQQGQWHDVVDRDHFSFQKKKNSSVDNDDDYMMVELLLQCVFMCAYNMYKYVMIGANFDQQKKGES